jgi:predicted ester cyclase
MDDMRSKNEHSAAGEKPANLYNTNSNLVDYILGITFEIWEQRQVEKIFDYYGDEVEVFSLDGITRGASSMVEKTYQTLAAYPDRLLLGDEVIYSGNCKKGFSSHRLTSPMTHLGPISFGAPTGQRIRIMNIADCEIIDGRITREWLVRDNLALVTQLGFDPPVSAGIMAENFDSSLREWLQQEFQRTTGGSASFTPPAKEHSTTRFAQEVLDACWRSGDPATLKGAYATYCCMHRSPIQLFSGRNEILTHYANWRDALPDAHLSIDNVCSQPFNRPEDGDCMNLAVRWSVAGTHQGSFAGNTPTGKPVYIVGVTHWKIIDGRIASEWTIFDELAMLAQTLLQPE